MEEQQSRPGTRFVCQVKDGSRMCIFDGHIYIIHPYDHPKRIDLDPTGKVLGVTEIKTP